MGRYSHLVGRQVDVKYRDAKANLFAAGTLLTDSGNSISLEAQLPGGEIVRWKIPCVSIIHLHESNALQVPEDSPTAEIPEPLHFKRRSARIPVREPVVLSWQEGELERMETASAILISQFGCALRSHQFFQPGTRVRLDYAGRTIEARVVYSLKDYSTNLVEAGLGFDQDGSEFWQVVF